MFLSEICQILGLIVITWPADNKYSLRNGEYFHNQIKRNYIQSKNLFRNILLNF